jgi:hypothetical protein
VEVLPRYLLKQIRKLVLRWTMRLDDKFAVDPAQFHGTALLQSKLVRECFRESEGKAIAPFLNS